jgi:hypothetical protein
MQSIILANNDLFGLNNVTTCLIHLHMHAHCFNINNSQACQSNEQWRHWWCATNNTSQWERIMWVVWIHDYQRKIGVGWLFYFLKNLSSKSLKTIIVGTKKIQTFLLIKITYLVQIIKNFQPSNPFWTGYFFTKT